MAWRDKYTHGRFIIKLCVLFSPSGAQLPV